MVAGSSTALRTFLFDY